MHTRTPYWRRWLSSVWETIPELAAITGVALGAMWLASLLHEHRWGWAVAGVVLLLITLNTKIDV